MLSAATDPDLRGWLRWHFEHGSNFMRALAEAALMADAHSYAILRPALLEIKRNYDETLG